MGFSSQKLRDLLGADEEVTLSWQLEKYHQAFQALLEVCREKSLPYSEIDDDSVVTFFIEVQDFVLYLEDLCYRLGREVLFGELVGSSMKGEPSSIKDLLESIPDLSLIFPEQGAERLEELATKFLIPDSQATP